MRDCADLQQEADDPGVSRSSRGHQRRFATLPRRVDVGTSLDKQAHHFPAAVQARQRHGGDTVVVGGINECAGGEQSTGGFDAIQVGCPGERRGAVGLGDVDVHPG